MENISNVVKAQVLNDALPYIRKYHDKVVVIKYGGNAMTSEELKNAVMSDIVLLSLVGIKTVLVHGGGPEISEMLKRVGIASRFVNGLRYTDADTAEIVRMVLAGKINKSLVSLLEQHGGQAIGLCGSDGRMIRVKKMEAAEDLGYVGEITSVNVRPVLDALDIAGYNYTSGRYEMDGKLHPERVIYGSETFPQDIAKNWAKVERLPYLVGDFMWTGWDYLGEVGLGAWSYEGSVPFGRPYPWLLSDSGVINILGRPDFSCRYAAAVWGKLDGPAIGVRPCNHPGKRPSRSVWRGTNAIESWSWQGCDGNAAVVEVCGEGASVVLHLNGKRVGRKRLKDKKALFRLRYVPGTLEAVLYDRNGKATGRTALRSAAGDLCLHLEAEGQAFHPGQVVYLPLTIRGENGVVESNADEAVTLTVKGGELLGFGSANPCTTDRFDAGRCTTYQGCALAVVRLGEGPLTVTATGTSLPGATLTLTTI